jgi:hypothetical protein
MTGAQQVLFVSGRQASLDADGDATACVLERGTLAAQDDIAQPHRRALAGERALTAVGAGRVGIPEKMNGGVGGRADAMDGGVRHDVERCADHRHADGNIETFAGAVGQREGRLGDRCRDGVVGRDDIRSPAAEIRIVVGEDCGHVAEAQSIECLERELLQVVAERESAAADRLGAVGQNRAEALRRSHERAGRRVELVGESGGRRRNRERAELSDERDVDLDRTPIESAPLKCAECVVPSGSTASLSTTSPRGP